MNYKPEYFVSKRGNMWGVKVNRSRWSFAVWHGPCGDKGARWVKFENALSFANLCQKVSDRDFLIINE